MTDTSRELLSRFTSGSEEAAEQLFAKYVHRLTALARLRLSERIARRVDPEDIVLSAYRSFFVAARDGRFDVQHGGDLWRLLVSITMHKLQRQVAAHQTLKRSVKIESFEASCETIPARDPTPEDVLSASEELEAVLSELPVLGRRILELRLQGETLESIAVETSRTERTVRRMLDLARSAFQRRLDRHRAEGKTADPPVTDIIAKPSGLRLSERLEATPVTTESCGRKIPAKYASQSYGDFLLQKFIGSGGSGKVYRAIQRSLDRHVAIKFLKKSFQKHTEAVERFVREAMTVAGLNHPGIVQLHGLGRSPAGGYFIVMDWLPGGDLNGQIRRGPVAIQDAVRWVRDAALAVDYVHEQGVVHCDLKPGNLLLDDLRQVRITDFGHARSIRQVGEATVGLEGTASFMAIEQAAPGIGEIGPWTDVYGLGAVLYALLTGRAPYIGKRPSDVLSQLIAKRPFPLPSSLRADIPPELETICLSCLNRDPAHRPASAKIVAGLLSSIIENPGFSNT